MNYLISHHRSRRPLTGQAGFTIVELMIATAVLATILLLATILMTNIGNLYEKGVNQANTQDDARTITDQVSQDLKYNSSFSSGSATATLGGTSVTVYAYCIGGGVRYSFITGHKIGSGTDTLSGYNLSPHVLWRDDGTFPGFSSFTGSCDPVNVTSSELNNSSSGDSSGTELMADNSRLSAFNISSSNIGASSTSYSVLVGVAYGDVDLLNNASSMLGGGGNPTTVSVTCAGNVGDQFCATASLSTTVVPRIAGGS